MIAIRGPVLTYTGDAFREGVESTLRYEPDAIVAMAGGKITHFGPAGEVRAHLPDGTVVKEYGKDKGERVFYATVNKKPASLFKRKSR